jgi:hypothetical protein
MFPSIARHKRRVFEHAKLGIVHLEPAMHVDDLSVVGACRVRDDFRCTNGT